MEATYGVGTKNRFILDDEYSDPSDISIVVSKAVKEVNIEEKENSKVVPKPKAAKKKAVKSETTAKAPAVQGKGAPRGGERPKLSDQEERNNRRNKPEGRPDFNKRPDGDRPFQKRSDRPPRRDDQMTNGDSAPRRFDGPPRRFDGERKFDDREGGMRGRGRGMGRGGRGMGRGGRGREFDRHSGSDRSGVRATDKRDGGGNYNWGSNKDQIEEEKEAIEETEKADTTDEGLGQSGEDSATENKEPEEPQEMTLSEYKALLKAKRNKPEVNVRKAGEGENTEQWKSTFVLKKKDDVKEKLEKKLREKSTDSSEDEKDDKEEKTTSARTKTILMDIDFHFSDSPMRGRGRGRGRGGMGRGMGRGGRGRGGNFARTREQQAPKMDDEGDFPSLK